MDKVLDKLEFEAMLAGLGVFLSTQELRTLTNHFDHNKDGMISYDEFVQAMRVRNFFQYINSLLFVFFLE